MRLLTNAAISLLRSGKRFITPKSADETSLATWIGHNRIAENWFQGYETLAVTKTDNGVLSLKLNRPAKMNAFNMKMWEEMEHFFQNVERDVSTRVIILSGEGKCFSAGMDLNVFDAMQHLATKEKCEGRKREAVIRIIRRLQNAISAPEKCRVPVIAAVHGACIGGAVDLITSCDLRYCDESAIFSVKEIDLGIVADIGTLQRLPSIVGEQRAKELSFTGRNFTADEAKRFGLVLESYNKEEMMEKVNDVAAEIAKKSPLSIRGVKACINYQRDHTVEDSLNQVSLWNGSMLYSNDLLEAFTSMVTKKPAKFMD